MMEAHVELTTSDLFKYLHHLDEGYSERAVTFVREIAPILATINHYFPYYTRHDSQHSFKVLGRMARIIKHECLIEGSSYSFSKEEVLLLIASAYAHDLGMAIFPGEEDELLQKLNVPKSVGWETNPVLQGYLRKNHSNRGGTYVDKHYDRLGIPQNMVKILDQLMRAHNDSIIDLEKKSAVRLSVGEEEIDLVQLACILCISDALEFSDTRVLDGVIEELTDKLQESEDSCLKVSLRENLKNKGIGSGVAVSEQDGKIIFTGHYSDPEVLNLAHHTIDQIEKWVQNYCDLDYRSTLKRLRIRSDSISRSLTADSFDFERLGIRMRHDNVIGLITSNNVWTGDKGIALRELLQNSIESCRYRRFHSSTAVNYHPLITIKARSDENTITIADNGCGMLKNVILNNFLTVGNSRSADPTYKSENFSSLARFGVGFWSGFTIAEKVAVETAPFELLQIGDTATTEIDGLAFEVSVDQMKDYTIFKPMNISAGTTVKLYLKNDTSMDLI